VKRFVFAALVLAPAAASAQAVGDACVAADFVETCASDTAVQICRPEMMGAANGLVENLECPTVVTGSTGLECAARGCVGADCPADLNGCVGGSVGASCVGESVFYDSDMANNANFLAIDCGAGLSCKTVVAPGEMPNTFVVSDSCVESTVTCTDTLARCDGQLAVTCNNLAANAFQLHPTIQDCATFPAGFTCEITTPPAGMGNPYASCAPPPDAGGEGEGEGDTGGTGEGEGEGDAGGSDDDDSGREGEGEDPPSCDATSSSSLVPFGAAAALLALVTRRRRA
jgi:uncharacterized protein (TIGR03382 family)